MEFTYVGIDKNSVKQKGTLEADNEREVINFLRSTNVTPITIKKLENKGAMFGSGKVKTADIIIFTRQLSSMALTGLTLIESLKILEKQVQSLGMRKIITDI